MEPIDQRNIALLAWLKEDCQLPIMAFQAMIGDASFRRYFRVSTPEGSYIAMDAPPPENCLPFVAIAKALRERALRTPEIIAKNLDQGFLLLSDFGDATFLKTLNHHNADTLYRQALSALSILQGCRNVTDWTIPLFTREWMWREWYWFEEWFLGKLLGLSLSKEQQKTLEQCFSQIVESAAAQPQVFMHRDFHSANLMVLANEEVGILDFQDAFIGPLTYDLVSLLRDCYINWPPHQVISWVLNYWQQLSAFSVLKNVHEEEFLRWFDLMGMQRHLKALFTFARKYVRDQAPQYLKYVPRTLKYLEHTTAHYPEFYGLYDYLNSTIQPAYEKVIITCEQ